VGMILDKINNSTEYRTISEYISENKISDTIFISKIDDKTVDLHTSIPLSSKNIELLNWEYEESKQTFWHTTAHVLAAAIEELYPTAKLNTGPSIENGFYYDIDFGDSTFSENDLGKVENKMKEIIKRNDEILLSEMNYTDAKKIYQLKENPYKLEIVEKLINQRITFYSFGGFSDLCAGPHISSLKQIKAFKLTSISGAYWKGNVQNKMLTRIYGVSFPAKELLINHLEALEKAKSNDHRKIGKELELFHFDMEVGLGLPLWLPKGEQLRQNLINFLRKIQQKNGYQHVVSPHIGQKDLYITSGHYAKYGEDSFQPIATPEENESFILKPMNCPHHCKIYSSKKRSYKELPLKFAEFGTVYRYEQHGELHGLTRVRSFTQDDAHLFCTPSQLKIEFQKVIDLVNTVYSKLGFSDFETQISLRDSTKKEKYLGTDVMWELAETAIIEATQEKGLKTTKKEGEAAFYGPKLDFMVRDAIGGKWQIGTIQVDYMMPENFDLSYIGEDNQKHRPVMIHRALFGSLERFIALLIEQTGGKFPAWLAPQKAIVLPISDKYEQYASEIANEISDSLDITIEVDNRNEKIGKKVREAQLQKIPYMLIVGENEMNERSVSVRKRDEVLNQIMKIDEFIHLLNED
jgi:threonyl-tRNA synthetase